MVYLFIDLNIKRLCNLSIAITSAKVVVSSTLLANILNLLIHIPNTFPVTSLFLERSESNRISLSLKFFLFLDFHALLSESKGISGYRKYCCFCITCKIAFLLSIGSCHGVGRPNVLKHTIIDIAKLLFLLQHRKINNDSKQMQILCCKFWLL